MTTEISVMYGSEKVKKTKTTYNRDMLQMDILSF